jgi:hypothetical protein
MTKVLLLFVALTLILAYPLSVDPAGRVLAIAADTDLFIWTLAWDAHALVTQPLSLFDANIYYPQARTLAYSENLIGGALFSAPVWWLTGNPVLAMNIAALASCALCGAGAWLLARRLGAGPAAAILAGVIFAFAPPRFLRLSQLHLTLIQWMPFGLAFLHSYLDRGRPRDLRLAATFFSLQALSSGHGAVFLALSAVALLTYRVGLGEPLALRQRLSDLGLPGAMLLVPAVLVAMPYLAVQREMDLKRSLADASTWSVSAASFLASPTHVHQFLLSQITDRRIDEEAWAYLFPGYLPLALSGMAFVAGRRGGTPRLSYGTAWTRLGLLLEVLALAALFVALVVVVAGPIRWRIGELPLLSARTAARPAVIFVAAAGLRLLLRRRAPIAIGIRGRQWIERTRPWRENRRGDPRVFYGLLLAATVWLSAGPPIGLWPSVYWLPGFNFIRVASRFTLLGVLCLAVLSAFGFDRLTRTLQPSRRLLAGAVLGTLLVLEFAAVPLATSAYAVRIPAADRWLATRPAPFSVVELPVPTPGEGGEERRQTLYMLHSMAHWQKTVHGYSGLRPPLHAELFRHLRVFPDADSISRLQALGVDYAVVHTDLYPPGEWPKVEEQLRRFAHVLKLEHVDETGGRVYSIN